MLCFGHVAACFLSKRFYILGTCIIFHEIMFSKELLAFRALYFIQGAFILLRALLFFLYSAFLFLHSAFLMLHSALFSFFVSQHLYIFSNCESAALFYFTSKLSCSYYFNFLVWSAYLLISVVRFLMIVCINININFVQNF